MFDYVENIFDEIISIKILHEKPNDNFVEKEVAFWLKLKGGVLQIT